MRVSLLLGVLIACVTLQAVAKQPFAEYRPLPSLKEQDALERKWLEKRYERIPEILKGQYVSSFLMPGSSLTTRSGYDAWLLSMREYAEDTAFRALVPATTQFWGRRRTVFLFHTHPNVTNPFHYISLKDDLWEEMEKVLESVDPKRIAINVGDRTFFWSERHRS